MTDNKQVKDIVFDLVAKHGLTVLALGFLAYFIIDQAEKQRDELAYWRDVTVQINTSRKIDADRFFGEMENIHERLAKVELLCGGKFVAQKLSEDE